MRNLMWCEKHWSVVKGDRHVNGILASLLLTEAFTEDARVKEFCGRNAKGLFRAERLNEAQTHFGPVCCFVGEEKMGEIYKRASAPRSRTLEDFAGEEGVSPEGNQQAIEDAAHLPDLPDAGCADPRS